MAESTTQSTFNLDELIAEVSESQDTSASSSVSVTSGEAARVNSKSGMVA